MNKEYYVYCAYGVNNEILYIGKGSDGKRKQGYLILDDLYKEDYL